VLVYLLLCNPISKTFFIASNRLAGFWVGGWSVNLVVLSKSLQISPCSHHSWHGSCLEDLAEYRFGLQYYMKRIGKRGRRLPADIHWRQQRINEFPQKASKFAIREKVGGSEPPWPFTCNQRRVTQRIRDYSNIRINASEGGGVRYDYRIHQKSISVVSTQKHRARQRKLVNSNQYLTIGTPAETVAYYKVLRLLA
jgi:hypothetical protein